MAPLPSRSMASNIACVHIRQGACIPNPKQGWSPSVAAHIGLGLGRLEPELRDCIPPLEQGDETLAVHGQTWLGVRGGVRVRVRVRVSARAKVNARVSVDGQTLATDVIDQ
eukprot:scaffold41898_cov27-Phaeocystis_antarctica.AAC.1